MIEDLLTDPDFVRPTGIRRSTSLVSSRGRLVEDAGAVETILASVQPSAPEELESLDAAERDTGALTIWTLSALASGDRLVRDGGDYLIRAVERWDSPQGVVTRAVATVEGVG